MGTRSAAPDDLCCAGRLWCSSCSPESEDETIGDIAARGSAPRDPAKAAAAARRATVRRESESPLVLSGSDDDSDDDTSSSDGDSDDDESKSNEDMPTL